MAIPVTNIPVLTGEVAERFIEQCEYNARHIVNFVNAPQIVAQMFGGLGILYKHTHTHTHTHIRN